MHMHIVSNSPSLHLLIANPHPQPETSKQRQQTHTKHLSNVKHTTIARKRSEPQTAHERCQSHENSTWKIPDPITEWKHHWAQCTKYMFCTLCHVLYQAEDLPLSNHYLLFIKVFCTISALHTTSNCTAKKTYCKNSFSLTAPFIEAEFLYSIGKRLHKHTEIFKSTKTYYEPLPCELNK